MCGGSSSYCYKTGGRIAADCQLNVFGLGQRPVELSRHVLHVLLRNRSYNPRTALTYKPGADGVECMSGSAKFCTQVPK